VYKAWTNVFGCNLEEMEGQLDDFSCLNEFFTRALKANARPVDASAKLVSPCDGLIVSIDEYRRASPPAGPAVTAKRVRYSAVHDFLGLEAQDPLVTDGTGLLLGDPAANGLFSAVIYLAPGDYHRFHGPGDFEVQRGVHVAGELLTVGPRWVKRFPEILRLNERVSLLGRWEHGFFAMTAVGAYNVGSIAIRGWPELQTNEVLAASGLRRERDGFDAKWVKRGAEVGRFEMGSTIVLIFEAPRGTQFCVEAGQKVKVGQPLIIK
jgi:phosphatidylserine decarboxylase